MILFPHTTIFSIRQFPLFLLAPQLTLLRGWKGNNSQMLDCFTKEGFCQVEYPAPFASDEEDARFSHLLTDIAQRKDDYATQLGALTVADISAAMSSKEQEGEHSARSIAGVISGKNMVAETTDSANRRWQARLVLALGEFLYMEQEVVDAELTRLDRKTQTLFTELHGGEEGIETGRLATILSASPTSQRGEEHISSQMNAWQTLFGEQSKGVALLTQSRDAAAIYEEEQNGEVCAVSLPALIAEDAETACKRIHAFHGCYHGDYGKECAKIAEKSAPTKEILAAEFPPEKYGRSVAYILL